MKPATVLRFRTFLLLVLMYMTHSSLAQDAPLRPDYSGNWQINLKLSDDTDKRVEESIRAAGGRPNSGGKRGKGRYKGGPPEHALYDHISYDETLVFAQKEPEFRLTYADGFERVFYSDNRKRVVSASGTAAFDKQDFSFASWDGDKLLVESRPRDGGWINETFEVLTVTGQLRVTLELKPSSFGEPIHIVRIYDRLGTDGAKGQNSSRRN